MSSTLTAVAGESSQSSDWPRHARIVAYGLTPDNAELIVREATESHVNGIEVDKPCPQPLREFPGSAGKLEALRKVSAAAHKAGNHAFVYIAGSECITTNADQTPHTLAKEHPDWLQRKRNGEPAVVRRPGFKRAMKICGSLPTQKSGERFTWTRLGEPGHRGAPTRSSGSNLHRRAGERLRLHFAGGRAELPRSVEE